MNPIILTTTKLGYYLVVKEDLLKKYIRTNKKCTTCINNCELGINCEHFKSSSDLVYTLQYNLPSSLKLKFQDVILMNNIREETNRVFNEKEDAILYYLSDYCEDIVEEHLPPNSDCWGETTVNIDFYKEIDLKEKAKELDHINMKYKSFLTILKELTNIDYKFNYGLFDCNIEQ